MTHFADTPDQPSATDFWDPQELPTTNNPPAHNRPTKDKETAFETKQQSTGNKKEIGGREGPEPTRFGDWEKNGRCVDF